MSDTKGPILVFGATGRQGGAVARALLQDGWPVRALVRDTASSTAVALREAGAELVQGSFTDSAAIRSAMNGAYGVFSVVPGNLPDNDEVVFGCLVADAAVESGVAHLVYSSGASAGEKLTGVPRFDAKPKIEAHIRSLPITATIVRPMIFMEMLPRPGFGLEQGRYTFFLRSDQAMQLIAVEDIGKIVAAVFADKARFAGQTFKIASDTVTGSDIEAALSDVLGRPIAYSRFPDELLATNPDLKAMSTSLEEGPLSVHADMDLMRELHPGLLSLRSWLAGSGRKALDELVGTAPEAG